MKRRQDHSNSCKRRHLIGGGLRFRGLTHSSHGRKHGMQADTVMEKDLRVLSTSQSVGSTKSSLSLGDLKAHLCSDTWSLTRPRLLIMPLPVGQAFTYMSLCGPFLFKPLYTLSGKMILIVNTCILHSHECPYRVKVASRLKENCLRLKRGSVTKSTCSSSRRPGFNSHLMPSSSLHSHQVCQWYKDIHANKTTIHTHKK